MLSNLKCVDFQFLVTIDNDVSCPLGWLWGIFRHDHRRKIFFDLPIFDINKKTRLLNLPACAEQWLPKLFKKSNLNLEMRCNLKTVDYVNRRFDLDTGIYKPYKKMDNFRWFINKTSNQSTTVLKQIPKSVSRRISSNSCNEHAFKVAALFSFS